MISDTRTKTGKIGVVQISFQLMISVRDGCIVEVAANNDPFGFCLCKIAVYFCIDILSCGMLAPNCGYWLSLRRINVFLF